jgi:hypothetical protein
MWGQNDNALQVLSYPEEHWDEVCAFHARRLGYGGKRLSLLQWRDARRHLTGELHHFVSGNRDATLLFSAEGLYSLLTTADVARFRGVLESLKIDAKIIVYVREPLSLRLSNAGQFIKMGWSVDLGEILLPHIELRRFPLATWEGARTLNTIPSESYVERLRPWEEAFPGRVEVRTFDPHRFGPGGIVSDFCQVLGINVQDGFVLPGEVNVGLPWPVLRVLNEVNAHINRRALLPDGTTNTQRPLPAWELDRWSLSQSKPHMTISETQFFRSYFTAQNAELSAHYFQNQKHLWDAPQEFTSEESSVSMSLTESEMSLAEVIVQMNKSGASKGSNSGKLSRVRKNLGRLRSFSRLGRRMH